MGAPIPSPAQVSDRIRSIAGRGAVSDIFLSAGQPVAINLAGHLTVLPEGWSPEDMLGLGAALEADLADPAQTTWERAMQIGEARFRVSVCRHQAGLRAMLRLLPVRVPTVEEVGVPEVIMKRFLAMEQGLMLVTGPTGSGKSTTIAALLGWRAAQRPQHILTLEDPIEYLFPGEVLPNRSLFTQRQIHRDEASFAMGLRHAMRQAPKVIMVGEIRDGDTAEIAIQAAETGHVVVATLHTPSVDQTVQRYIQLIPTERARAATATLADVLEVTLCQRLVRGRDGQVVPLHEILLRSTSTANAIREANFPALRQCIEIGSRDGHRTFKSSIQQAVARGDLDHTFRMDLG